MRMAPLHRSPSSRHLTTFQIKKNDSRFIFNKTIAGHYRNGRTGYNRVGVLLITWEEDDMNLEKCEVGKPYHPASCAMIPNILRSTGQRIGKDLSRTVWL